MLGPTTPRLLVLALILLAGCDGGNSASTLPQARQGFRTKLVTREANNSPPDAPPPDVFRLVTYEAEPGSLQAYLGVPPRDGKKHPAMIWITGGDCNSIGECWVPQPRANDQSAAAFREAGILMMYPSLRGGNGGPGRREGFLGEVDDVLAAAEFLSKQPGVDPARIYLGGHSTGGTLALLVAECSDRFRAVFSFGPVGDVSLYGDDYLPFDWHKKAEVRVRSPIHWLSGIHTPTFVIEGDTGVANVDSLRAMQKTPHSDSVQFFVAAGHSHFTVLAPVTALLAKKIVSDTGPSPAISVSEDELRASGGR